MLLIPTSYTFDVGYRVLRGLLLHHSSINNSASLSNKFWGFYFSFKFSISGLLHHVVTTIANKIRGFKLVEGPQRWRGPLRRKGASRKRGFEEKGVSAEKVAFTEKGVSMEKGVGLRVADSLTGNHREDGFTPLETFRGFPSAFEV
uniref:Uncharacterized protein n=1 Tax=Tanacetum cinerariifolium TaxID=118510 RepID=A0A699HHL4_TANCI|nr:hypothetical protein [Tanacetum cinerariifolium]